MRTFAFGTGTSPALHQVREQGCPSSRALSSRGTEAGKRYRTFPVSRPRQRTLTARGSRYWLLLNGLTATLPVDCLSSVGVIDHCAGFSFCLFVTLAPKPILKSLPSIHMRCRMPASLRATATIAHNMPDRLAIRRPTRVSRTISWRTADGSRPPRKAPHGR
jgi:hypothetical protein